MKSAADKRRADLRADVATMRELGVLQWNGILLGPEPPRPGKPLTEEQREQARIERLRRQHETMFAATPVRPRFEDVVPRGVTAPGHGVHGT